MSNTPNPKYIVGLGKVHVRVPEIKISYPSPYSVHVDMVEAEAVTLNDNTVRQLGETGRWGFTLNFADFAKRIPIVHPDTDQDLGPTISIQDAYMSILAVTRWQQRLRDDPSYVFPPAPPAPAPSPTPDPEPEPTPEP